VILQRFIILHIFFLNWDDTKDITAYWRVNNGGIHYRGFCSGQMRKQAVEPFSTYDVINSEYRASEFNTYYYFKLIF
jgi:hypothetical protein